MEFDLAKASKKLCELDLNYTVDGLNINILWFRAMTVSGSWTIERHMHSSFEFHFIREGSCEVITASGSFIVGKEEFYLTAPGVFHEQRCVNAEEVIEYSLNCDLLSMQDCSGEMANMLNTLKNSPSTFYRDRDYISCCRLFEYALKEAYFERTGFFGSIKNIIPLILINAARKMAKNVENDLTVPRKSSSNNFRMSQIERFINDNMSTSVTTASIASYMHLSKKQVCRIIQEAKNMPTKEFVNSIKLLKAKELLKNSDYPIKKISDILGFSSEYYFSQFFKNMEGYPPATFRGNILNK
ncbi:MAG: transcriptional regulator, AraC family [Eubacterium sp.]|nr:transcriptional regulator, AraC family [Eubacterium sp.]